MQDAITLDMNTPSVRYLCKKDKRLAKVISMVGAITYAPHTDGYPFLVHEIIEQMLSIKAGQKIYARLEDLCDGEISPDRVAALSDDEIRSIGTSKSKVAYIRNITNAIVSGDLVLADLAEQTDAEVTATLTNIRGIGSWTAKMYLIFVLNRPDILPWEDGAFLQSYRWMYKTDDTSRKSVEQKCRKWKPYSSVGARFLYRALDMGLTKSEFHLFKKGEVNRAYKKEIAEATTATRTENQQNWTDSWSR